MAIVCPASVGHSGCIQATKQASKRSASSSENTRPKVSCEAMPLAKGRKRRSHCSSSRAHFTTLTQSSAPLVTAHSAASNSSSSGYGHLRLRGSSRASNACPMCSPPNASPASTTIRSLSHRFRRPSLYHTAGQRLHAIALPGHRPLVSDSIEATTILTQGAGWLSNSGNHASRSQLWNAGRWITNAIPVCDSVSIHYGDQTMTLEGFRAQMEAYREAVDEEAKALRDSYFALERLHAVYRSFDSDEQAMAHQVLMQWALSDDEGVRFDALALIDDFKIAEAVPALQELTGRLVSSRAPGAPFELQKVNRILGSLTQR